MQDSIQLDQSNGQIQNHNQFQFNSVISPKGRRLNKQININTASHQSLAYSNSTYNKNQFTQRSPPLFNIQNFNNNQNINTLNFRSFDRKQSTFGSNKGLAIQFDKIKQESYLSNFDDDKHLNQPSLKQKIDFPCFLSNQNSPNNKFNFIQNDSLNSINQQQSPQHNQVIQQGRKYNKINPTTRKQIKETIVKQVKDKVQQKSTKSFKSNKSIKDSKQKSNISLVSNDEKRSKSPLQMLNKSSSSQFRNTDQISSLKQKIKQLEYSLQVESISTEELRTKVSVLNQLLQERFLQKNGINFKLFKNSSPNLTRSKSTLKNQFNKDSKSYSNIDLYVQMKVIQKSKQQLQIQYERVHHELAQKSRLLNQYALKCEQLTKKLMISQKTKNQTKTQTSLISNQNDKKYQYLSQRTYQSQDNELIKKINSLQQQKQSLKQYIENQNQIIQQKDDNITNLTNKIKQQQIKMSQTQSYAKLYQEKQKRFIEIQRPKFISQIKQMTEKLDFQRQQIQKLQMQNNLIQFQLNSGGLNDSKLNLSPQGKQSMKKFSIQKQLSPSISIRLNQKQQSPKIQTRQTIQNKQIPDAMSLILLQQQQLRLLKIQRDHFRQQYQRAKSLQKQNYSLKLKNQDLENQLNSLHQLIQVDDQITF